MTKVCAVEKIVKPKNKIGIGEWPSGKEEPKYVGEIPTCVRYARIYWPTCSLTNATLKLHRQIAVRQPRNEVNYEERKRQDANRRQLSSNVLKTRQKYNM